MKLRVLIWPAYGVRGAAAIIHKSNVRLSLGSAAYGRAVIARAAATVNDDGRYRRQLRRTRPMMDGSPAATTPRRPADTTASWVRCAGHRVLIDFVIQRPSIGLVHYRSSWFCIDDRPNVTTCCRAETCDKFANRFSPINTGPCRRSHYIPVPCTRFRPMAVPPRLPLQP